MRKLATSAIVLSFEMILKTAVRRYLQDKVLCDVTSRLVGIPLMDFHYDNQGAGTYAGHCMTFFCNLYGPNLFCKMS